MSGIRRDTPFEIYPASHTTNEIAWSFAIERIHRILNAYRLNVRNRFEKFNFRKRNGIRLLFFQLVQYVLLVVPR